jgi:hypothetical protein
VKKDNKGSVKIDVIKAYRHKREALLKALPDEARPLIERMQQTLDAEDRDIMVRRLELGQLAQLPQFDQKTP